MNKEIYHYSIEIRSKENGKLLTVSDGIHQADAPINTIQLFNDFNAELEEAYSYEVGDIFIRSLTLISRN